MFVVNALFIAVQVQRKMMTLICSDLNNKHSIVLQLCIVEYQYYFVLHKMCNVAVCIYFLC